MRIVLALFAVSAWAQNATVPQLYVSAALPGDGARKLQIVIIDDSLTLTRDGQGNLHLGAVLDTRCAVDARGNMTCDSLLAAAFSAASETCTTDPQGNKTCIRTLILPPSFVLAPVRNEIPIPGPTPGTWTLKQLPMAGATCKLNGLVQTPGLDYTLAGSVLTSQRWPAGAALMCDYEYSPAAAAAK